MNPLVFMCLVYSATIQKGTVHQITKFGLILIKKIDLKIQ